MTRQPRVFISRTTAGLKGLAERVAEVLRQRGIEPIIQTGFYPSTHDIKGMLAEHLQPPVTNSYGKKMCGKKWNPYFCHPSFCHQIFAPEPPEQAQRQQTFITEIAKDGQNTYGTKRSVNGERGMRNRPIRHSSFRIRHFPASLGTLFKGRDEFLAEFRQHLTAEGPVVIKGKRTIHGMGGVGKTRAAIEYAWKHADDYRALLFISADTPEALRCNLASLCGPLVLNLPEQNEKEQALQVEAALRWLKLHPGWFLIIDNVDTEQGAEEAKAFIRHQRLGSTATCLKIAHRGNPRHPIPFHWLNPKRLRCNA